MDMEGWRFVMDVGIATVVAVLLGTVLSFIFNAWVDSKGWKKVKEKIGDTSRGSLNIQHEDIKDSIVERTSSIYDKVSNIDKEICASKKDYENLNLDQKEVRNNVNKLVLDWERAISENKELKSDLKLIREENQNNIEKCHIFELNNKHTTQENNNLKEENRTLKLELGNFKTGFNNANQKIETLEKENDNLERANIRLENENRKLSSTLDLAKERLGINTSENSLGKSEHEQEYENER